MYIDPGVMSLIIASIAGAILWLPYYFRRQIWGRVKLWFRRGKKREASGTRQDR